MKNSIPFLLLTLALFGFFSCSNNKSSQQEESVNKIPFTLNMPGAEVVEFYPDSTPRIVFFHAVDASGKTTEEIIGQVAYFEDKSTFMGGSLKNNLRNGLWQAFFRNGNLQSEGTYVNGKEDGLYRVFYENGKPFYEGNYELGKMVGKWHFYDETGKLSRTDFYEDGVKINSKSY